MLTKYWNILSTKLIKYIKCKILLQNTSYQLRDFKNYILLKKKIKSNDKGIVENAHILIYHSFPWGSSHQQCIYKLSKFLTWVWQYTIIHSWSYLSFLHDFENLQYIMYFWIIRLWYSNNSHNLIILTTTTLILRGCCFYSSTCFCLKNIKLMFFMYFFNILIC
jgi:hypothetical protein